MPYCKRVKVDGWACGCARCGHEWTAIGAEPPRACAKCSSRNWLHPVGELKRGRPPKPKKATSNKQ